MQEKIRKTILYFLDNIGKHASHNDIINYLKDKLGELDEREINNELLKLARENKIISHVSVNKEKRYEAEVRRHYHFICRQCGAVRDLFMEAGAVNMTAEYAQQLAKPYAKIDRVNMSFQGICHECRKEIKY